MIYLVFGEQELMINKMIDKIAKEHLKELNEFNMVIYDAIKTPLYQIINDAQTVSFISDKKVIVINNAYFLTSLLPKLEFEQTFEELEEYLKNPFEDAVLVFSVVANKLDERKKIVKTIKDISKVYSLDNVSKYDLPKVVKQMFTQKKVEITDRAVEEFIARVGNDMYAISNEINKLSLYSKKIDLQDIYLMVSKRIEDNVFEMIDYLFKGNLNQVFSIYNDLKLLGEEPVTLISQIASQVRFLYQVSVLYAKDFSETSIANELSAHPYRVKMAIEKLSYISKEQLQTMLAKLADLDFQIKSGEVDRFIGFELFLINAL